MMDRLQPEYPDAISGTVKELGGDLSVEVVNKLKINGLNRCFALKVNG